MLERAAGAGQEAGGGKKGRGKVTSLEAYRRARERARREEERRCRRIARMAGREAAAQEGVRQRPHRRGRPIPTWAWPLAVLLVVLLWELTWWALVRR